jgi:hypothetical protein
MITKDMQPTRMKTAIIISIFIAAVLLFFSDVLFGPEVLLDTNPYHYDPWQAYGTQEELSGKTYRTDALVTYLPRRYELTNSIRSGRFPLWNPYIFAGTPFFADPQSRVVYPISLLLVPLAPMRAMGYDVAIHVLIAMVGMYLFLRSLGCSLLSSALGAFSYAFSSFFFQRVGHPTFIAAASWIPFLFYGFEKARESGRKGTVILVISLTMGYLAGFPQVFAFGVGALTCYGIYIGYTDTPGKGFRGVLRSIRILATAGVLSLLMVSVQLVPFLEFVRNSTGLGITYEQMSTVFRAPPVILLRFMFPTFFGHPVQGTDWSELTREVTHSYDPEFMIYCGAGTLLAAIAGLAFLKDSRRMRVLSVFLLFSAAIATSPIILKIGYLLLPVFRVSRVSRISVLGCFALSAMAALSLSRISGSTDSAMRRRFVCVVIGLVVVALAVSLILSVAANSIVKSAIEKARALPEERWLRTHAQTRSIQIKEWAEGTGAEWLRYERSQIRRGVLFLLAAALFILVQAWPRRLPTKVIVVVSLVFLHLVVLDLGSLARSYLISQPSDCLFEADGIKFLKEGLGGEGRWRIRNLSYKHEDIKGLPPNTNQIFGIPSLTGQSTIIPGSYTTLFEASEDVELPARLQGRVTHIAPHGILLSDMACVRYILSSSSRSPYLSSPVLSMVAGQSGGPCDLKMLGLGGETRPAIRQSVNEPMRIDIDVPSAGALDFAVGFDSDATAPGHMLVFLLTFEVESRRVEFRRGLDLFLDKGRWHEFRLDISELGSGMANIWMGILLPESSVQHTVTACWSGLDLVYDDCPYRRTPDGYEIEVRARAAFVRLRLRSEAREIPLEIVFSPWLKQTQWIGFPPGMAARQITADVSERASDEVVIRSDSLFLLEECKAVAVGGAYPGLELVHDSDLYVYENFYAVRKAVCVDKQHVSLNEVKDKQVLMVSSLGGLSHIGCGEASIISYEPERIELDVVADRDSYLLFQDSFYPGWKAYADGEETSIIGTDTGMRAIALGKGRHRLVMEFKPRSFKIGLALTCLGLVLTVAYAAGAGLNFAGSELRN